MTSPVTTEERPPEGGPIGSQVGFDELEAMIKASEEAAKAEEVKAAAAAAAPKVDETLPENLRGKTPAEIAAYAAGLERSLKLSEDARREATREPAPRQQEPPPQAPALPTAEQLQAAWDRDPIATTAYIQQLGQAQSTAQFERRIAPLLQGLSAAGEQDALRRYGEEFELFGPEIRQLRDMVQDKSLLASPEAWDQIVSVVRGRPGNIDKLLDRRVAKREAERTTTVADAQRAAAASVPLGGSPAIRRAPIESSGGSSGWLDDVEREIAANLGVTDPKVWQHWKASR